MSPAILYFEKDSSGFIQSASLAGIRRYAQSLRWDVVVVPLAESRPGGIPALLAAHRPVAGCIVDGSGGRRDLPPRLFGEVPVVYMHADPSLYGGRGERVGYDDAAIAEAAFRELSAGLPAAFAVVPFASPSGRRGWSLRRERAFAEVTAKSGKPFYRMPWRKEPKEQREARLVQWLASLPRHTAIFAVGDMTAFETAAAARLCRRSIPRELTLLGVDSDPVLCEASHPTLSSIQIDHELAGYLAARLLAARMKGRAVREMKGQAEPGMKGRAVREMKGAACAANAGSPSFAPKAHSSFGGSAATRHCGEAAPSLPPQAAPSLQGSDGDGEPVAIGPLLAIRRESTGGSGRREPFVLEAVEIIRREACDGITAAELAGRFRCSRPLFDRRFREAVGHSPLEEILHVRLEKVFTLLSRTDTPVGAVADFCGFRSHIALHWLFKKRTGMSMSEWRKRNRHP